MWLKANDRELQWFLEASSVYWEKNLPPASDDGVVLVEAFHQDIRVNLRNLAFANALRQVRPARLIVLTGVERQWHRTLWSGFDVDLVRRLGTAFGATDVVDVWAAARSQQSALTVAGRRLAPAAALDEATLVAYTDATYCRLAKVPRLPDDYRDRPDYQQRRVYANTLSAAYQGLLAQTNVVALVTSHVDYDQWGLLVESARRARVPIIHTQQTGCMKAYGLYPETDTGTGTFREELTRHIGTVFDEQVWTRRDELQAPAELVAWRAKVNLGRPSWWRGGISASVDLDNAADRARLCSHVAPRLGFDPDRPIVTVYNHAVSDALGTNRELFASLADWFTETAAYAAGNTDAQWLFLDHPSQALYDSSGFFDSIARQHKAAKHLAFRQSATLSKNALWSLTDLGVTVRGSVSNELPAYGIPVIQAGWSEWSSCGLSTVVDDAEDYFKTLEQSIAAIRDGADLITAEQVRRARLWLWLYRSGTDIVTPLVPQWEVWPADHLLRVIRTTFRHIESDADPLFTAVERMWTRREPMLTRLDLAAAPVVPAVAAASPAGAGVTGPR